MIDKTLVLDGGRIRLEPLESRHAQALHATCNDPELWRYTFALNPLTTLESTRAWIEEARSTANAVPFAIVDKTSGNAVGSTRFGEIDPAWRKLEIGWTFLARPHWRTHANTEAKLALMTYAFETFGAVRVQFKAQAVNARSRAAIARIGATFEGVLRNFRIREDGTISDISIYSVTDREWPDVKERLRLRLYAAR
jgi:RimJ/RimL family protein N-acetyltransferase